MSIRRALNVMLVLAAVLLTQLAAQSPPSRKVPLIGVLAPGFPATYAALLEAFREALRELGYVEGQTIAFEYRYAEERVERLSALAAELVRLKVDLILTASAPGTDAAKRATAFIPIVCIRVTRRPSRYGSRCQPG